MGSTKIIVAHRIAESIVVGSSRIIFVGISENNCLYCVANMCGCQVHTWKPRIFESWPAHLWGLESCLGFSPRRLGFFCCILGPSKVESQGWWVSIVQVQIQWPFDMEKVFFLATHC